MRPGAAKVSPGWAREGASCCCCLLAPCSMEMAALECAGKAACRETGMGWESAGNAAPAELRAHGEAALGKGDGIQGMLPYPPNS